MARHRPRSSPARWAAISAALVVAGGARAETPPERSSQSLVVLPQSGLTIDLGGAVRLRPTHLGASQYRLDVVPVIDGQWGKDLHFSLDDGVQYTALQWDRLKIGPDMEYRQAYNERLPPRANRTADALETGGFAKVDLTYAELDMRVRKALNGYEGWSSDVSLSTLFPVIGRRWFLALEARGGWADRRFALVTFGRKALPGGPFTHPGIGDYYSAGAQAALVYLWRPRTRFIAAVSDDVILRPTPVAANTDSRDAGVFLLAVTHRFSWGR